VKVLFREGQEFPEGSVPIENAEHSAIRAVALQLLFTVLAVSASCVDFAYHSLSYERMVVRSFDDANEFMTQDSSESEIPSCDFEVGVANTCLQESDKSFATVSRRLR
jgi:hypothetical protein